MSIEIRTIRLMTRDGKFCWIRDDGERQSPVFDSENEASEFMKSRGGMVSYEFDGWKSI